ncbi:AAA-like domain protein [compost metagenome]
MLQINLEKCDLVPYRIIPSFDLDCSGLADFVKPIGSLYSSIIKRVAIRDDSIDIYMPKRVVWETHFTCDDVKFLVYLPSSHEKTLLTRLDSVLGNSVIRPYTDLSVFLESLCSVRELKYEQSPAYSISTNLKREDHVKHLIKFSQSMEPGDTAVLQIVISPTSQDWKQMIKEPRKTKSQVAYNAIEGVSDFVEEIITQMLEGKSSLGRPVHDKKKEYDVPRVAGKLLSIGFLVQIRVAAISTSHVRRGDCLLSLSSALRACDATNSLICIDKEANVNHFLEKRFNQLTTNKNLMSAEEIAKLIQLPSSKTLTESTNVEYIRVREMDIHEDLTTGGITIGTAEKKLNTSEIFFPTTSVDSLCLPRAAIGEMGSGKSSYASCFGKEAFDLNYNVVALDVADGRMVKQLRDSVAPDQRHRIKHLDLGNMDFPIALVWNEAILSPNRMASEFIKFIQIITGELGVRTRRWMKKAFLAVFENKSATVLNALQMITDDHYRATIIPTITNQEVKDAWIEFESMDEKLKNEIMNPVLNRLDYLMDDDNLVELLGREPRKTVGGKCVVDFAKWLNQDFTKPYESNMLLITVPKSKFGSYALDIIVAFVINKLWLTIMARDQNTVLETGVPTFILMDEPHQFMKSADLWEEMVVESRKWRGGLVWFFHTWEQIRSTNPSLAKIIKSAGIHYMLFKSSKDTWRELHEEIHPFTIPEALEIPKYHAIVKVAGYKPILSKIVPPVDVRFPVYDNSSVTLECSKNFCSPNKPQPSYATPPPPITVQNKTGHKIRL